MATPSKITEIRTRAENDLPFFCRTFLPETFYIPFPQDDMTDLFFRLITDRTLSHVVIAAHRGFGKTSIVAGLLAQLVLYRKTNYIVYASLTDTVAVQQTESIKTELESNHLIHTVFGNVRSPKWAQDQWETMPLSAGGRILHGGTKVFPRGVGQQIRGTRYRNRYRPDFIIVDDVQDRKTVKSEALRKEAWTWFDSDVMRSTSPYDIYGPQEFPPKVIVIGNVIHDDTIVVRLLKDAEEPGSLWKAFTFPICDGSLRSLRPGFISDESVRALHDDMERQGSLDVFTQEYRCQVLGAETQRFKKEHYRYYDENEANLNRKVGIETVICCDPAQSTEGYSCYSAITAIGVDLVEGQLFIREVIKERLHPDAFYARAIDLAIRYKARVISCGTQGLAEYITYPFANAIHMAGAPVEFIPIPETRREGAKKERIGSLVPFYRTGKVQHSGHRLGSGRWASHVTDLEAEQELFPNGSELDVMDSESHIVWLLDNSERFMDMPDAAELDDEIEAEYAALDDEFGYEEDDKFDHAGWKAQP